MEWDNCSTLHIFINSYAHLELHTFAHYVFSLLEYLLSSFTWLMEDKGHVFFSFFLFFILNRI